MPTRRLGTFIGWSIALLLVGSLVASLKPGGRGAGADQSIDPAKLATPDQLDARLTVWGWNIAAKGLRSILPAFNERYPNVGVDVEMTGANIQTRFLLALSSGTGAPDVSQLQCHEAPRYITTRRMTDLTAVAAKYEKDFPAASWANCVFEGKIYAIPWDVGPCGVYYKRDIFAKYDIDPARIETWDDYINVGVEILQKSGGRTRMLSLAPANLIAAYEMHLQQLGGQMFDAQGRIVVDSPESRRVMDLLRKMRDAGLCADVPHWGHEWMAGFNADSIATYPGAAWLGGTIKDTAGTYTAKQAQWGVFPLPAFERGGLRTSNLGGSVLVIPDQCASKEAAWAFVEYALCTREGQLAQFAKFDLFPAYLPALDDPLFQQGDAFFGGQKTRALFAAGVKGIPVLNRTADWVEANNYASQSFTTWASERTDTGAMLTTLSHKLSRRLGREMAPR